MKIALPKCSVFSVGSRFAPPAQLELADTTLPIVHQISDLGILFSSDLKFSNHCARISAAAYSRSVCVLNSFVTRQPYYLVRAYTSFVRPLLEYGSPIFSPFLKRDINVLERVQRFFTRKICKRANIHYVDYRHRLEILKLDTLQRRRVILDLCFIYKLYHGLLDVNFHKFFCIKSYVRNTRSRFRNSCMIEPKLVAFPNYLRALFFVRVCDVWNSLPDAVILAPSIVKFRLLIAQANLQSFCSNF